MQVGDALRLTLDAQDGLTLPVGIGQRGLELVVGGDQTLWVMGHSVSRGAAPGVSQQLISSIRTRGPGRTPPHLDLLDGVHDEHVLQVLHGALHPVVEGRCPLGVLQVQLIDGLQLLLRLLQGQNPTQGERGAPQSHAWGREGAALPPGPPCGCGSGSPARPTGRRSSGTAR